MNPNTIGKIKSVALRDFLTYDELQFHPGDHLNIIIGPNGTGKSTIVAAIILGCGGEPALLSRSKSVSDYVKNGKQKARIEIELIAGDKEETATFVRAFDKNNKETFSFNGESVNKKAYLRQVKQFNIQVDNLCMFMPQDRVQDFTKMNPQELLLNTQTSVCPKEINEAFEKLLTTRNSQKNNSKTRAEVIAQLNDNINRNEQLGALIESNKQKDKLIAKMDMLMKKRAWCEFDEISVQLNEVDADSKSMAKALKKKVDALKPLRAKQQSIAGAKDGLKNAISKAATTIKAHVAEMDKLQDAAEKTESEVNRAKQDMRNIIASVQDHKKLLKESELLVKLEHTAVENAKQALTSAGDTEGQMADCDRRMREFKLSNEKLQRQRLMISHELEDTVIPSIRNCERKIKNLANTEQQRVGVLRQSFEDTYKAYEWLQSNRQNFRGKVFNPIMVEITVNERDYAKYVESTVAIKDLTAFVCTDKEDMKQLIKKFRNEMKLHVNFAYSDDTDQVQFKAANDITDYAPDLGLQCYLIDLIQGPAPVINFLCRLYSIHMVGIGDDRTFNHASSVPEAFRLFFSTEHRFSVSVSKYSNKKSTSSSMIEDKHLLNVAIDRKQLEHEQRNLQKWNRDKTEKQKTRSQFETGIEQNEKEMAEIRTEKQALQKMANQVRMCTEKLRKKQAEFDALKNRTTDVQEERIKFKRTVDGLIAKTTKVNEKRADLLGQLKTLIVQRILAQKKLEVFEGTTGNVDDEIRRLENEIGISDGLYNRIKVKLDDLKTRAKNLENSALKMTDGVAPSAKNFQFKAKFEKLPATTALLQNEIDEMQGRIDCIKGVDPRVVTEFEERKKAIEELEANLANENHMQKKMESELAKLHDLWYPAIRGVVETINSKFSKFFNLMGFVGEVELVHKEERDYADYGIQIRVQYRDNERLQALNRHVQSGGERAVAIAVYTLSLQHMTSVPFRCVDEINQGMDPKNERKIFQMLVDITCRRGQSQYFFVTPKLLPNLPYNKLMTVTVVHNGKYINDPSMFIDDDEGIDE